MRALRSAPRWDEVAVAIWLQPSIISQQATMAVDADHSDGPGYGNTLSWPAGGGSGLGERDVSVVFEVNVAALEQLVVENFSRPVTAP